MNVIVYRYCCCCCIRNLRHRSFPQSSNQATNYLGYKKRSKIFIGLYLFLSIPIDSRGGLPQRQGRKNPLHGKFQLDSVCMSLVVNTNNKKGSVANKKGFHDGDRNREAAHFSGQPNQFDTR